MGPQPKGLIDIKTRQVTKSDLLKEFKILKRAGKVDEVFEENFNKDLKQTFDFPQTFLPRSAQSLPTSGREPSVYYLEPMMIFKGRGDHPMRGRIKQPVNPKNVIVNVNSNEKLIAEPQGGFKSVVTIDSQIPWRLSWRDTLTGNMRYLRTVVSQNEESKFEMARKLKRKLPMFRKQNRENLLSKKRTVAQCATAAYLIDNLWIRAGNEKEQLTTDTVGCCTLECQHAALLGDENRKVKFSFLGKDSVPFQRTITVIEPVYLNLKLYQKGKKNGAQLFDAIDTGTLNRYINRIVPEMTAKVFRMCNACISFESALSRTNDYAGYVQANEVVARMLNHKKYDNKKKKWVSSIITSRTNYLDPRITIAYCQHHELPLSRVFSATLRARYKWALSAPSNFRF